MEQLYSVLPPLPTGPDACSESVRSVYGRGFYDVLPSVAHNPLIMAQFLRLVEEAGELIEVAPSMKTGKIAEESADVVVADAQLAWLYDMDLDALLQPQECKHATSLLALLGRLARAMRKEADVQSQIGQIANHVRLTAGLHDIDIRAAMLEKLAKDEQRGIRHGEARGC